MRFIRTLLLGAFLGVFLGLWMGMNLGQEKPLFSMPAPVGEQAS